MEKRLQDFILSVQQLSDLRNLDVFNPIVFQMEHPITATRYEVVGAKIEPSYLGLPINVTWVVLDPADPYYLKALKLKTVLDTETVTDKPKVQGLDAWWHIVRTYDEIFNDPQYYIGIAGPAGPVGPTGPAGIQGANGAQGADGVVDMNAFLQLAMAQLSTLTGTLEIRGPAFVPAAGTAQYEVWLTEPQIQTDGSIATTTRQVFTQIIIAPASATPLPVGTMMGADGVLHAGPSAGDVPVRLTAEYPSWLRVVQQQLDVSIGSKTLQSISINGAASLYAGSSSNYTVTATFSDGSSSTVTPVWSIDNTGAASISVSGNLVGANPITQDGTVVLTATFDGQTITKTLTVRQLVASGLTINGVSTIQGGNSASYTATVTLNSGATATVVPTWSLADSTNATVDAAGLVATTNVGTSLTLQASYLVPGTVTPVTATKTITVSSVVQTIYPYYGPGPAAPTNWESFITSLPYRGLQASVDADVSFDCLGQNTYMYFASPVVYGQAQFFDKISQFFGGWGGGGATGPGPSAASIAAGADVPFEVTINVGGVPTPFYVYRSDYANLGAAAGNKWLVSSNPVAA